ncbi:hypothetical protein [uncultured Sphingomonas sp.]|uniref:hypothetical protein n=1 Tax=uncultured Sphingomonas sp. TaxID=158754 RepID=UPI002615BC92|nr:hypothetical protein [uncultured Sphingomonas sp.]
MTLFGIFAGFLPRFPRNPREQAVLTGELLLRLVLSGSLGYICKDSTIFLTLLIAVQLARRSIGRGFSVMGMAIFIAVIALFLLSKTPNFMVIVVAGAVIAPFFCQVVAMLPCPDDNPSRGGGVGHSTQSDGRFQDFRGAQPAP